jgi:sugar lactone lactonase YvrE
MMALGLVLVGCSPASETSANDVGDSMAATAGPIALVEGMPYGQSFHGIHGMTFGPDDTLYAGSVVGQATYTVDTESGAVNEYLSPPLGMADDLEWSPDGEQLAWTGFLLGKVFAQGGEDGNIVELASGFPGANSIAYKQDGRLFFSQVFAGDALWELDPTGVEEPRKILENVGGLNGFDFGPDGWLYGPLWFKGQVVRVNVDTGEMKTVAEGFQIPAAVNFDSTGNLWVVDTQAGEVLRVDVKTGARTRMAEVPSSIDNLAIDSRDRVFISNMADNGIYQIGPEEGTVRTVREEKLAAPAGIAYYQGDLHVADTFAYRVVDSETGAIEERRRMFKASLDELDYPVAAFADAEEVILTSWTSSTVQRIDRKSGDTIEMIHGFNAPVAGVRLPDGRLVVAELGSGKLVEVATDGERRTVVEGLIGPAGLALAADGTVYLTEVGSGPDTGSLAHVDLGSGEKHIVAEGLRLPEGVAVAANGKLVVAEVGIQSLVEIDPGSGERRVLAVGLPIGLPSFEGGPPAFLPTGVAAAPDGSVYFTSDLENAIYKLAVQ